MFIRGRFFLLLRGYGLNGDGNPDQQSSQRGQRYRYAEPGKVLEGSFDAQLASSLDHNDVGNAAKNYEAAAKAVGQSLNTPEPLR